MSREVHVQFWERAGVKLPRATHLPLYRQERIYASRHGVELSRQTMAQWMGLCADWLRPIYESIRTGVMGGGYVQVDETPIRYLEPGHGKTRQGYLWACSRPGGLAKKRFERGETQVPDALPVVVFGYWLGRHWLDWRMRLV